MKKVFKTLCLVAMVALVATSCKKNEETASISVEMGEISGYQENPSFDGSKAYFTPGTNSFAWSLGDSIVVYNVDKKNPLNSESAIFVAQNGGSGHAQFEYTDNPLGSRKDQILVFYSSDKANQALNTNGNNIETFVVDPVQHYNPAYKMDPKSMVMASVADNASNTLGTFSMQYIFGFVNIGVGHNDSPATSKTVDKIVIRDAHWHLTGALKLKVDAVDPMRFTTLMNQLPNNESAYLQAWHDYQVELNYQTDPETQALGNEVTLMCNQALTYGQWTNFYIALRPGALYRGFTIEIYCNGATTPTYYKTFTGTNYNHLIKPGVFRNFYFLTSDPNNDNGYYMEQNS
jgi:hypothetical protein